MPVQVTTAAVISSVVIDGIGNPLKWKVSAEEVIVYFSVCTILILFLIVCLGTLFQWMVSQLIICSGKMIVYLCCIGPATVVYRGVTYKTSKIKKKSNTTMEEV